MSLIMDFLQELINFINDMADGKVEIEDARTWAAALQAKMPEQVTDRLLAELDAKIAALEE